MDFEHAVDAEGFVPEALNGVWGWREGEGKDTLARMDLWVRGWEGDDDSGGNGGYDDDNGSRDLHGIFSLANLPK